MAGIPSTRGRCVARYGYSVLVTVVNTVLLHPNPNIELLTFLVLMFTVIKTSAFSEIMKVL